LMFIIYMDDIGSAIKDFEYYLFADDTLLSVSGIGHQCSRVHGEIES
jgi:hypothetical protein